MLRNLSVHHVRQKPLLLRLAPRFYSQIMSDAERKVYNKLTKELEPSELEVADISGGCGSMFAINVTSDKFKGISMVKQHKLVNSILSKEISQWHGLQLSTKAPKK